MYTRVRLRVLHQAAHGVGVSLDENLVFNIHSKSLHYSPKTAFSVNWYYLELMLSVVVITYM